MYKSVYKFTDDKRMQITHTGILIAYLRRTAQKIISKEMKVYPCISRDLNVIDTSCPKMKLQLREHSQRIISELRTKLLVNLQIYSKIL